MGSRIVKAAAHVVASSALARYAGYPATEAIQAPAQVATMAKYYGTYLAAKVRSGASLN